MSQLLQLACPTAPNPARPPSKNRVGGSPRTSAFRAPKNRSQLPESHRVLRPAATTTASGRPVWPNRDPIGERGGLNLTAFVSNRPVLEVDYLGLLRSRDPNPPPENVPAKPLCNCDEHNKPAKDCGEVCKKIQDLAARKRRGEKVDIDINLVNGVGSIICSGNLKCPCVVSMFALAGVEIGQCPAIEAILIEHEKGHLDSAKCDPQRCGTYGAAGHSQEKIDAEDCEMRRKNVQEFLKIQKAGPENSPCVKAARAAEMLMQGWIDTNCEPEKSNNKAKPPEVPIPSK